MRMVDELRGKSARLHNWIRERILKFVRHKVHVTQVKLNIEHKQSFVNQHHNNLSTVPIIRDCTGVKVVTNE